MRPETQTHVEWIDNEAVVLDTRTGELHYLNSSAAYVYALILEHGFDQAMTELRRTHGDAISGSDDLPKLIDEFVERGLLIND
jgi:hypothetical protein